MPSNTAAYLPAANQALEIREAPYTPPGDHDIVIRNHAIALNPVDGAIQQLGTGLFPWLQFPVLLGGDVAGEVVQVGSAVTRFQVGDRVVGYAAGFGTNDGTRCGFQHYTLLFAQNASPLPDSISYERAVVVPLTLTTATNGLFREGYLALQRPSPNPKPTGQTVLVWGGATSVGCNVIQLAVAAGYEVIATSSPANFDLLKQLGASQTFNYKDADVTSQLTRAFESKTCAGAFCIAGIDPKARQAAADACYEVVATVQGSKMVALAGQASEPTQEGVRAKFVLGPTDYGKDELLGFIFSNYLPEALAGGRFVPRPEPKVVGQGLESLGAALKVMQGGVSASKVVVTL